MTLKNPIYPPNPMKLVAFTWIFDLTPGYVLFTMCEALLNKIFGGGNHCSYMVSLIYSFNKHLLKVYYMQVTTNTDLIKIYNC